MRGNHLYSTQFISKIRMHSAKQEGGNGQHEAQLSGANSKTKWFVRGDLVSRQLSYSEVREWQQIQAYTIQRGHRKHIWGHWVKDKNLGKTNWLSITHAAKLTGKEREVKQSWDGHPLKPQARGGTSGSHAPVGKLSPECLQTVPQHTEEISQMCCLGTRNTLTKNYTKISQTSKTYQLYWFWHQTQST